MGRSPSPAAPPRRSTRTTRRTSPFGRRFGQQGLPPLPVVEFPTEDHFDPGVSWKLAAVERYVRARPFAWLDDELGLDVDRWAAERGTPSLLLDVRPDHGLTEDHVETLLAFAAGLVDGLSAGIAE